MGPHHRPRKSGSLLQVPLPCAPPAMPEADPPSRNSIPEEEGLCLSGRVVVACTSDAPPQAPPRASLQGSCMFIFMTWQGNTPHTQFWGLLSEATHLPSCWWTNGTNKWWTEKNLAADHFLSHMRYLAWWSRTRIDYHLHRHIASLVHILPSLRILLFFLFPCGIGLLNATVQQTPKHQGSYSTCVRPMFFSSSMP